MTELQELLAAIEALDENAVDEVAALVDALDPDALADLRAEANEATETILAGEVTDELLATLELIGVAASFIDARLEAIASEDADRQRRAQEIADQIRGSDTGDDDDGEEETEEDEGEGDAGTPPDAEAEVEELPEPIAASARRPVVGRVAARRPASAAPLPSLTASAGRLPDDIADWGLVASANAPDTQAGARITTRSQLANAFLSAFEATKGYRFGPRVKLGIAHAGSDNPASLYGEDRTLGRDPGLNHLKIERLVGDPAFRSALTAAGSSQALVASGGICAPAPVRYDQPIIGSDDRPVRDNALTRFGADRGGVTLLPPPLLEDLAGAVDIWTEANDVTPSDPTVKPCLSLTCPDDETTLVDAITKCLEVGNFRARYWPEQVEAWLRLAAVQHARQAEIALLASMTTASTLVTHGQLLGTTPDVLASLDQASAGIASVNRLSRGFPLRWVFPQWLYNQMRADEARRIPGGSSPDERYAISEAQINSWLAARSIVATPIMDGPSGQVFTRQGDAPMIGWPSTAVTWLYPDGSHLFLDGGELNLGLFRDSTLVSTNDVQIFAETFEGHAFHGVESWQLTLDTCPSGEISGTVDIDPCTTGS